MTEQKPTGQAVDDHMFDQRYRCHFTFPQFVERWVNQTAVEGYEKPEFTFHSGVYEGRPQVRVMALMTRRDLSGDVATKHLAKQLLDSWRDLRSALINEGDCEVCMGNSDEHMPGCKLDDMAAPLRALMERILNG